VIQDRLDMGANALLGVQQKLAYSARLKCRSLWTVVVDEILILLNVCCAAAAIETETVKKLYTKITDAYGCLGVLNLGGCKLKSVCDDTIRFQLNIVW